MQEESSKAPRKSKGGLSIKCYPKDITTNLLIPKTSLSSAKVLINTIF